MDVHGDGRRLRHLERFGPAGTNVDFVLFEGDSMTLRTYERGVEAETLACGSGVLASAAVGLLLGRIDLPVRVVTAGGLPLTVEGHHERGMVKSWSLTGDACVVARGELQTAAAER